MHLLHFCLISAVFAVQSFFHVNSLECQYCSSTDPKSPCRYGNETNTKTCDIDAGDNSCYEEYIMAQGTPETPLFRRGCAPYEWCDYQKNTHGHNLKDCSTCDDDNMCNKNAFGSTSLTKRQCRTCASQSINGICRQGGMDLDKSTCREGQKCVYAYAGDIEEDYYYRECGNKDYCTKLKQKFGKQLKICSFCENDLCNSWTMPVSKDSYTIPLSN